MNIIILGPPGSGKGTQAKLLAEKLGLFYFEAGKFSRQLAKKNSRIRKIVESGDLIPEGEMTKYVSEYLENKISDWRNIIFDGYPRFVSQYKYLKEFLAKRGSKIDAVIYLDVSDDEIVRRLSARRIDEKTGITYNLITNPPPKEIDKRSLYNREDDKPEIIRERIREFREKTLSLISEVEKEGNLLKVNGDESIQKVSDVIMDRLGLRKIDA